MIDVIRWLVVVEVIGLAVLPLTSRAFRNLPDRGFAFARPVGVLVVGIALWFGCIFGLITNSGATVIVITGVLALSGWVFMPEAAKTVRAVWQRRHDHVVATEIVFIAAFLLWTFVRAHTPTIEATEKPMEFGFLNGILRSQRFPPADPWLSGNSISYYYLGYVVVAAITEASGVAPAVAFNLAIATLFAMTVAGSFAIGHALVDGNRSGPNAVRLPAPKTDSALSSRAASDERGGWIAGGLTALFVTILGNLEGFLEIIHAHGIGSAAFWQSLAIWHLGPAYISQQWYPTDAQDNWWWFRASRVILDYPPGTPPPDGYNTITEFPSFSFLLGDLHPHLLALPFAFVCLAFALSFLRDPKEFRLDRPREIAFDTAFIALLFGSMFLINAWDMLTYLFVLVCAFAARRYATRPFFDGKWLRDVVTFGVGALVASVLVYWPFYVTFRSQATGLLGVVQLHSHLSYFVLFWGPLLFLAASLIVVDLFAGPARATEKSSPSGPSWIWGPFIWVATAVVAIIAIAFEAPALALVIPIGVGSLVLALRYLTWQRVADESATAGPRIDPNPRESHLAHRGDPAVVAGGAPTTVYAVDHVFVLLLLFVTMLLLFGTELVYIQDSFNNRMNTVFKLYFQSWELLAIVGGYTVIYVGRAALRRFRTTTADEPSLDAASTVQLSLAFPRIPRPVGRIWLGLAVVLVAAATLYTPAALESRSDGFTTPMDLNGLSYYAQFQPDDAAGIAWLAQNVSGTPTIVEATGGSYSAFGEVAWMTGLPTILGWDFHEIQWHGASIMPVEDERKRDIDTIYRTTDDQAAQDLLTKYGVQYVYVGPLERQTYGQSPTGLDKFGQFMDVVYRNPGVTIYRARGIR